MLSMHSLWISLNFLMNIGSIISFDVRPEINKYCREKDRLISAEQNDEYLLVDAEWNTTILLECHFCREKDDNQPKIWYRQERYQTEVQKEMELGMNNNESYNRIHVTPDFSLVIKNFEPGDEGICRCHSKEGQEEEFKFNYRLEPVFSREKEISPERGNLTDWEKYRETDLAPITLRFAVSKMEEIVVVRDMGIILELISEWGPWSPCERCVRRRGFKSSRAYCRVKRRIESALKKNRTMEMPKLFSNSPMLPCRSIILEEEFPGIGGATKYVPEFILEQKCKSCQRVRKPRKDKFKYKQRYVLAEGAHLTITCPEANSETQVVWQKDAKTLEEGTGHSFRKKDSEPRVLVDTFATLYLIDVSHAEEGNYTCEVNNVKMLQVKVIVISKSRLLTQAFLRHMGYLGFILLLSSFCYCAGLVAVCRQKDKFRIKDYKKIEAQEQERPRFLGTD